MYVLMSLLTGVHATKCTGVSSLIAETTHVSGNSTDTSHSRHNALFVWNYHLQGSIYTQEILRVHAHTHSLSLPLPLSLTLSLSPTSRNQPAFAPVLKRPENGCSSPLASKATVATTPTEWITLVRPAGITSETSSKIVRTDSCKRELWLWCEFAVELSSTQNLERSLRHMWCHGFSTVNRLARLCQSVGILHLAVIAHSHCALAAAVWLS